MTVARSSGHVVFTVWAAHVTIGDGEFIERSHLRSHLTSAATLMPTAVSEVSNCNTTQCSMQKAERRPNEHGTPAFHTYDSDSPPRRCTLTVMSGHANLSTTHAWCPVWAFLMAKALNGFGPAWLHFNAYCEQLEALHDPAWSIPLPTPLPTKLDDLRNHQLLMEDIWISLAIGKIPRWVEDQDVETGSAPCSNEIGA